MDIKRTDALQYTTTEQFSKQAEFTQDAADFRKTQEKAKSRQEDEFSEGVQDTLEDAFGDYYGPDLPTTSELRPDKDTDPSQPKSDPKPAPTSEFNDKQKLMTRLHASNEKAFNAPPSISNDANRKQVEFTEAAANFRDVEEAHRGARSITLGQSFDPFHPNPHVGWDSPTTSELRNPKNKAVPTSESYTKQKLFTELMESNKRLPENK